MIPPRRQTLSDRKVDLRNFNAAMSALARGQTVVCGSGLRRETVTGQAVLWRDLPRVSQEPFEPRRGSSGPLAVSVYAGRVVVRGLSELFTTSSVEVDSEDGTKYVWVRFGITSAGIGPVALEAGTAWPDGTGFDLNAYGYIVVAQVEVKNEGILSIERRWFAGDIYFPGL